MVLAAHGARDPRSTLVIGELVEKVRARGVETRAAYADVREPDVTSVLREEARPAVVVPAFLSAGYHVGVDIPRQVAASGHRGVVVADPFGAAPELVGALVDRLVTAGYRTGDELVLACAGSRDPAALRCSLRAARLLRARLDTPVRIGYLASAEPRLAEVVRRVRGRNRRVTVAPWLVAPGDFSDRAAGSGADVVAEPLGAHPAVVELALRRYRAGLLSLASGLRLRRPA